MRWFHVVAVAGVACDLAGPERPVADFEVRCATPACEVALAVAVPVEDATYTWSIGGTVVGREERVELPFDSGELEVVTLEVETDAGVSRLSQVLLHTEAIGDRNGEPTSLAHGYVVVSDRDPIDRIVVTNCSEKLVVTSFIGGCFTGADLSVFLSAPSPWPVASSAFSNSPATFSLSGGGIVTAGDWEGARAHFDGDEWTTSASWPYPLSLSDNRLQTLLAPTPVPRWMIVEGVGFKHKEAVSISCDDETLVVGKANVAGIDGWPNRP